MVVVFARDPERVGQAGSFAGCVEPFTAPERL
jgi:hypothetical protein